MFPVFEELRFKGYKSFTDYSSVSTLKNVNVFIGRNNSGKSSCIDVLQYLVDKNFNIKVPTIDLDYRITPSDFESTLDDPFLSKSRIREKSKTVLNKVITLSLNGLDISNQNVFDYNGDNQIFNGTVISVKDIVTKINNGIKKMEFFRLNAKEILHPK